MPTYDQMMQPTMDALRALDGQASGSQIAEHVIAGLQLPAEIVSEPHSSDSKHTEIEYRLMWTRTYLKRFGLIDNPKRGVWVLSEKGRASNDLDPKQIVRTVRAQMKAERAPDNGADAEVGAMSTDSSSVDAASFEPVQLKSQTPYFPTYTSARYFLTVLDEVPYTQYRKMDNDISAQHGNPQEQVDWANPEEWIPDRLDGFSQELAERLWRKSKQTVNPRHVKGCWYLCTKHDLLERGDDDLLRVTELGQSFIDDPGGDLEAELDAYEGLLTILRIVADKGPGRRSDLLPDYEEYCLAQTTIKSDSAIKSYLYSRLSNLIDRSLIVRAAQRYEITDAGLTYLDRFAAMAPGPVPASEKQSDIRKLAKAMRDEARDQLRGYLLEMHPYRFEELITRLLQEMGYDDVSTTSATNDKGVDVVGKIELGITSVREVLQVKRIRGGVHRPVLDQLRGSLHRFNAVRGTIITTGHFSKGAREAAFERGAAPITLIDGEKLLDLLMDNEIGVTKRSVEYFEFFPSDLGQTDSTEES